MSKKQRAMPNDLITSKEAARIVGRSTWTLARWAKAGALTAYRFAHLKASACLYSRAEVVGLISPSD